MYQLRKWAALLAAAALIVLSVPADNVYIGSLALPAAVVTAGATEAEQETGTETGADTAEQESGTAESTSSGAILPVVQAGSAEEVERALSQMPDNWPQAPEIQSECAVVIEMNSKTILYAKNATMQWYPASITKIMTALLTLENAQLNEEVTFSQTAIFSLEAGASNIALNVGEVLTVEDSLYALLLPSANEVANGLAEHVGGDIAGFVEMMNARAAELGTVNTHFVNANGLHDDDHYSCAYDIGLMFIACIENATFLRIDSTPTYIIPPTNLQPEQRPIGSTHQMMRTNSEYYDPDIICGKTGWTQQSGRNLVSYTSQNGLDLVVVVLGAEETPQQYEDTRTLMDYCFNHFTVANIAANDKLYSAVNSVSTASPITIPKPDITLFELSTEDCVVLPLDTDFDMLTTELLYTDEEGGFATINYLYGGYVVGQGHLVMSDNSLDKLEFGETSSEEVKMEPVQFDVVTKSSSGGLIWKVGFGVCAVLLIAVIVFLIIVILRSGGKGGGRSAGRGKSRRKPSGGAQGPDFHKQKKRKSTHIV